MVTDGTAEVLNIKRATEFELTLYGKTFTAYTQAKMCGTCSSKKCEAW